MTDVAPEASADGPEEIPFSQVWNRTVHSAVVLYRAQSHVWSVIWININIVRPTENDT